MSDLYIYKASAGSGKTYSLTRNYLLMLYDDPAAYKNILAVTFTNKAAGEMKARILESLYQLASGDRAVAGYREELQRETGKNEVEINRLAREILTNVLNDYSDFHVSTIDKFFQMVIRGFTREIGLQAGYNLELNSDRILSEAVDRLMADLDTNKWLRDWLVRFADERIMAGKPWDPNKDIFRLGTEVFKEAYREIFDSAKEGDEFEAVISSYSGRLAGTIQSISGRLKQMGHEALAIIEGAGLSVEDFSYGSGGVAGYFRKIADAGVVPPGKRVLNAFDDPAKWSSASSPSKKAIETLVNDNLHAQLGHALDFYNANIQKYNTAVAIYRNIYAFGILNHISLKIREIAGEKNIFMLSDATFFLKKIIEGNPTPFVYEKAGNYFHHFMLDEFQDTSGFQWKNFAPLIDNALSMGKSNLIVGDVKQSIYRWRNSNWMILAREVENYFRRFGVSVEALNQNWRSKENIVRFNNTVFYNAAGTISELVRSDAGDSGNGQTFAEEWSGLVDGIYHDAMQMVPGKFMGTGGYVTARFTGETQNEKYTRWLRQELPPLIRDLQDRGYSAGDITILVRKGTEGRDIASLLLSAGEEIPGDYNFNVISNDSLYLTSNPAVNFLVAMLNFLKNPDDPVNRGFIRHEYLRYLSGDTEVLSDLNLVFSEDMKSGEFHQVFGRFYEVYEQLRYMPLYELSEQLIDIFRLNHEKQNLPYIQAFQDIVLDFIRNETSDINAFLEHWDKTGSSSTLNISEAQDAIRIMTIHKSKGLQFKIVVVPYCHWSLTPDNAGNKDLFLWCSTKGTGFEELGHVPVKYHRDLLNSAFSQDYLDEKFHSYIDNLNLLYVAFTRAEDELHIMAKNEEGHGAAPAHVGDLLYDILDKGSKPAGSWPDMAPAGHLDRESKIFSFGSPGKPSRKTGEDVDEEGPETIFLEHYPVTRTGDRLQLNIRNAYLSGMQEDPTVAIGYGTVMHEILSGIHTASDIEVRVMKAFNAGKVNLRQKEEMLKLLEERLNEPEVARWFGINSVVRTEQELVKAGKGILRPDRVVYYDDRIEVIDYKFGSIVAESHLKQVSEYMEALKEIEGRLIKGFVWYVTIGKTVEVKG